MGQPVYDIDEILWSLYVTDCQMKALTPRIKDFLIWCDEEDYDRPEVWDGYADMVEAKEVDEYQQEQDGSNLL